MVATLVKLNWKLSLAVFKRNVWAAVGMVFGLIYALGLAVMAMFGLASMRSWEAGDRTAVVVVAFAGVTVLWWVTAIIGSGVDQTLSPGRFALFDLRAKELMPGMLVSAVLSPTGLTFLAVIAAMAAGYRDSLVAVVSALVAGCVGLVTCLVGARALTSALAGVMRKRRTRDIAGLIFFAIVMALSAGVQIGLRSFGEKQGFPIMDIIRQAAEVATWTPFGWAWAVPGDLAAGRWSVGVLRLVLAVGLVVGLWLLWGRYLALALTSPLEAGSSGEKVKAHSWVDRIYPATPAGAIAGRSLVYWRRDPRHFMMIIMLVVMPFLFALPSITGGIGQADMRMFCYLPAFMSIFFAQVLIQELAYDGSAYWTHISTGVSGAEDRWGRVMAATTVMGPLILIVTLIAVGMSGHWEMLPMTLGLMAALYGSGAGTGSFVGAIWNYPVPPAGANAFAKNKGGSAVALLANFVSTTLTIVPSVPTVVLAVMSWWYPWAPLATLLVGFLTGAGMIWLGVRLGGRHMDKRAPELLKAVTYEK